MVVRIFCDGSGDARAGLPGGWAFIVVRDGIALAWRSGASKATTNNRMELKAALLGLREVVARGFDGPVELVSDSRFTLDIARGAYLPKVDVAQARALRAAAVAARAATRWVRSHTGQVWNEQADALAGEARRRVTRVGPVSAARRRRKPTSR